MRAEYGGSPATLGVRTDYDPFGRPEGGPGLATPGDYGFTGEPQDATTGLVQLRARWYQPGSGQFTSRDPFAGDQGQPLSYNPYAYAHADPVNNTDPTGLFVGFNPGSIEDGVVSLIGKTANTSAQPGETLVSPQSGAMAINPLCEESERAALLLTVGRQQSPPWWQPHRGDPAGVCVAGGLIGAGLGLIGTANPVGAAIGAVAGCAATVIYNNSLPPSGGSSPPGAAATPTPGTANSPTSNLPQVYIDGTRHSESAQHAREAIARGYPTRLTIDRPGAPARRRSSTSRYATAPGKDRDEYPQAVFLENAGKADVKLITSGDNQGSGALMANQINGNKVMINGMHVQHPYLPDGTKVELSVVP